MAFREQLTRLQEAGLKLNVGPTRTGNAALIARNVEGGGSIAKRGGFKRFLDVREAHPITGIVSIEDRFLVLAGDLDEQS